MEQNDKLRIAQEAYERCLATGRVRSKKDFAELIGIDRTTLSSAMNGNERYLTDSLVARIVDVVKTEPEQEGQHTVPLVPFAVRGGASLNDITEGVTDAQCERITSPIRGAEIAMEVVGDSMAPGFPAGARVLLRRVPADTFIAWGEVYVVETVNGPVLKRIMPTDVDTTWELRSDNPAYPPFKVRTEHVRSVWRVLLRMIQ